MYEARKICNFLLAHYDGAADDITNLRLNKLLYFIHGWSFGYHPSGLVRNHFEAWKLGPVIKPVYDAFKSFGENPITSPAFFLDYATGTTRPIPFDDLERTDAAFIRQIFEKYRSYSTGNLVALSHEPNGPWDVTLKAWEADRRLSPRIPSGLIKAHFVGDRGSQAIH